MWSPRWRLGQDGNNLDGFLTSPSRDVPLLVTFPIALAEVPHGAAVAQATTLPQADLVLVGTLLAGGLVTGPTTEATEVPPAAEVFFLLLPPFQARAAAVANFDEGGGDLQEMPGEVAGNVVGPNVMERQAFQLGLDDRWRELQWRQQAADSLEDALDALRGMLEQFKGLLRPLSAPPNQPTLEAVDEVSADIPETSPGESPAGAPEKSGAIDRS
jgi:hypothetical protein